MDFISEVTISNLDQNKYQDSGVKYATITTFQSFQN
jgi:hypothetical protein